MNNYLKGIIIVFCLLPISSMGQSVRNIKQTIDTEPIIIIDYGIEVDMHSRVPFRGDLTSQATQSRLAGTKAAEFVVDYIDFTTQQENAFKFALDIWSTLFNSDVPIHITAKMSPLAAGVLGQTGISRAANFDNAQKRNTGYAMALAEKIAGEEINGAGVPDINIELSSNFSFYFGTDLDPSASQFDFVSVVLHEIGHGLGFTDGTFESGGTGFYTPMEYDHHLETLDGTNLIETFDNGSPELGAALTSDSIYFSSFSFPTINDRPKLYAPLSWSSGSSIAHLDETTYPAGNPNSLMSPQFGFGEAIHDPGLSYEMFQDMGWVAMDIDFEKFSDSEDSVTNRVVTAIIKGDSAVASDPGSIELHYTYSDFTNEVVLDMTPTAPDEYTATIPATGIEEEVLYYITVDAVGGKTFTSPGQAPVFFWDFVMAADTIPPVIVHDSINLATVFNGEAIVPIEALVFDNIDVGNLELTYSINGGASTTIIVPLITSDVTDGFYFGEYLLDWDLGALGVGQDDTVEYKLEVLDIAAIPNSSVSPDPGFFAIGIQEFNLPVDLYENNFNTATTDFYGNGFTIGPETGFDDDALHSDHPYRVIDGVFPEDSMKLIQILKTPVLISDKDASLSFDEVVLVEPGTGNAVFGDDDFWDYVIVEGSNDLGVTWSPIEDGYDSEYEASWLEKWESNMDVDGNSLATGNSTLYIKHEMDMAASGEFVAGDTVLLRFRVYIDQLSHGWGWAIDNLKIQVDEKPPVISQITPDYLMLGDTQLTLKSKVEDNVDLDSVVYEIDFNGQIQLLSFPGTANLFTVDLAFPALTATDVLKYRIIAVDKADIPNTAYLPETGFFDVPVAVLQAAKSMYVNDFNTSTDDFIGNNFSIMQPDKFNDPALVSPSPYPDAPFETDEIYYLLKFPITLNQTSAWVQWDEMVLVEPGNDMVAFEVSKDGGVTWIPVFDPYDASAESAWNNLFSKKDADGNSTGVAEPFFMERRFFNILHNPDINGGDEVLVRFRMTVNDNVHGWGWIIDNLEIQGPTTAIEDELSRTIQIYPNPTSTGSVILKGTLTGRNSNIVVTDILGKAVLHQEAPIINNSMQTTLNVVSLKRGIYLISVSDNVGIHTSRLIIE